MSKIPTPKEYRKIKHRALFGFLTKKISDFEKLDGQSRVRELQMLQDRLPLGKKLPEKTFQWLKEHAPRYKVYPKFGFIKKPVLIIRTPDNKRLLRLIVLE